MCACLNPPFCIGSVQTHQQSSAGEGVPGSRNSIEEFIQHFLANPEELAMLQQRSPQIAQALLTGNIERIREAYMLHREQLMVSTVAGIKQLKLSCM